MSEESGSAQRGKPGEEGPPILTTEAIEAKIAELTEQREQLILSQDRERPTPESPAARQMAIDLLRIDIQHLREALRFRREHHESEG